MKNTQYTHNKWFVGTILLMSIYLALVWVNDSEAGIWAALMIIPWILGVIIFWPIDYLIHKRTMKQLENKPVQIDPNFPGKRKKFLVIVAIYFAIGGIIALLS